MKIKLCNHGAQIQYTSSFNLLQKSHEFHCCSVFRNQWWFTEQQSSCFKNSSVKFDRICENQFLHQGQYDCNTPLILNMQFQSKILKSKSCNFHSPTKTPYSTCECQCEQESEIGYVTEAGRPEAPPLASTHYYPSAYRHTLKTAQYIWLWKVFKFSIITLPNYSTFTALVNFFNVAEPSFKKQSLFSY